VGRTNRVVLAVSSLLLILEGPTAFVGLRDVTLLWWLHSVAGLGGLLVAVRPHLLLGKFAQESEVQWDHVFGAPGPRHTGLFWRPIPAMVYLAGIVYIMRGVHLLILSTGPTTAGPITVDAGFLVSVASSAVFGAALLVPPIKYWKARPAQGLKHP